MQNEATSPKEKNEIEVVEKAIVVPLGDDINLSLSLPSAEELRELENLSIDKISVTEVWEQSKGNFQQAYRNGLKILQQKYDRFKESPTYLNHLSNFSDAAGDKDLALKFLKDATYVSDLPFFRHREIFYLLEQRNVAGARAVVSGLNLADDGVGNLSLAYISVLSKNFDDAEQFAFRAVELEPLNYRARMALGAIYLARGKFRDSVTQFKIAGEEQPNSSPIFSNLAVAYLCMQRREKALHAAKRAVALNPLNHYAVMLYSDLLMDVGSYQDAQQVLKTFLKYEPKELWALERLAKAFFLAANYSGAVETLRNQVSLGESPAVFNNLGIAYWKKNELEKAAQYLSMALLKQKDVHLDKFDWVPVKNLLSLLLQEKKYKEVEEVSNAVFQKDVLKAGLSKNTFLAKAYVSHLIAKAELSNAALDLSEVEYALKSQEIDTEVKCDLLVYCMYHFSTAEPNEMKAIHYIGEALKFIKEKKISSTGNGPTLINNVLFGLLELNRLDEAEKLLPEISRLAHHDPNITATLGLYHFKKGNIDRGERLYNEAVGLAKDDRLKERLRQKLFLELGKSYLSTGEINKAERNLKKAISIGEGLEAFKNEASKEMEHLKEKKLGKQI